MGVAEGSDDAAVRTGWLMRSWRLASPETDHHRLHSFADELRRRTGTVADVSTISRWERGARRPPDGAVRAYENVLGLPRRRLRSVARWLGVSDRPAHRGHEPEVPTTRCLERLDEDVAAVRGGVAQGAAWAGLADACMAGLVAYWPPDVREEVAHRLVDELPRAVGCAWLHRVVALRQMLEHPTFRPALLRAIGEHVTTPHAQAAADLVANLRHVASPDVLGLLVRLTRHDSASVRSGALWALGSQDVVTNAGFALGPGLASIVGQARQDPEVDGRLATRVANGVPLALPDPSASVDGPTYERRREARGWVERVSAVDDPLGDLTRDALDPTDLDRRQESCVLLMASPHREDLARHAIDRLSRGCAAPDEWAFLLTFVTGSGDTDGARAVLANESISQTIRWQVVAHSRGPRLSPLREQEPSTAHLYALGMRGRRDDLDRLATAGDLEVAGAARWWRDRPGAVHDAG